LSRFTNISRAGAAIILLILLAALGIGALESSQIRDGRPLPGQNDPTRNDLALYRAIVDHVKAGESYESAAVREQRKGDYPLKPFVVVRPPVLATLLSWLPNEQSGDLSLAALGVITIVTCVQRLKAMLPQNGVYTTALIVLLLFSGVGSPVEGSLLSIFTNSEARGGSSALGLSLLHEAWAGLLIALSFILRTEDRFVAAVAVALMAALIRELAMPYLAVMAAIALMERRRVEAAAFLGALALSLGALALHAHALSALVRPDDIRSPGWVRFGGYNFILATAKLNLVAVMAGAWATVILVPFSLLGSVRFKNPFGLRLAAILFGYTAGFAIIGRPENAYWGLMIIPMASMGLAIAPWALTDLIRPFTDRGRNPGFAATVIR
jgi:hypothetical protein